MGNVVLLLLDVTANLTDHRGDEPVHPGRLRIRRHQVLERLLDVVVLGETVVDVRCLVRGYCIDGRVYHLLLGLGIAAAGASVALVSRDRDALQSVHARIKSEGGDSVVVPADVSDVADTERMVATTVDMFGRLDVAVNSAAAHGQRPTPLADSKAVTVIVSQRRHRPISCAARTLISPSLSSADGCST